jgi:uncharacterized Fe-S cluster protein YjdI
MTEERHRPDVVRSYEGDRIVVGWEPKYCIHTANCIRHLPQTFNPQERPWIAIDSASADEIAQAIRSCPTGALTYRRTDGEQGEVAEPEATVRVEPNGPLYVRGDIEIADAEGGILRKATRVALCRCGASGNKPFCDNTHRITGFRG